MNNPFVNRAMPGTAQQGMLSPLPMPVNQTLVPTGGYGTGTNYIPMGARMLTPSNGYATQPMMMPPTYMNPYAGLFSAFMQQPGMADLYYQSQMNSSDGSGYPGRKNPYFGSQLGRDIGFGLLGMPGLLGAIGHFITGSELDAITRSFEGLPTTTGGDGSNERSGGVSGGFGSSREAHDMGAKANPGRTDGGFGL